MISTGGVALFNLYHCPTYLPPRLYFIIVVHIYTFTVIALRSSSHSSLQPQVISPQVKRGVASSYLKLFWSLVPSSLGLSIIVDVVILSLSLPSNYQAVKPSNRQVIR